MFGYVLANGSSLSKEEKAVYKAHYCGLCRVLRERYGQKAMMALSYDMVFLEMVLSDLTGAEESSGTERCIPHPVKEHAYTITSCTEYAADMQMLLGYYSLLDQVHDEGKHRDAEKRMRRLLPMLEERYPRQSETIRIQLDELGRNEGAGCSDPEGMSLIFGTLLGEVFVSDDSSFFRDDLKALGCSLGRFIYLLDAWCDRKRDARTGSYNPLPAGIDAAAMREMLLDAASSASDAFERLPLDQHVFILRNILYSGIWSKFKEEKE